MEKIDSTSLDLTKLNIEKLKELFPNVVTEGKIDFDALRTILGDEVDSSIEKYQFTWPGKRDAIKLAQTPSTATLRPDKESSKDWDTTENLYIEGDNLEVLKLLQKTYYGKIKMIYIDPPYNTGKDFIYTDDRKDSIANYLNQTEQGMSSNAETDGRFHSKWLNLLYPRLVLARNLLADDGVIFISIDDNELINLKKICDEIFGENNFVNIISAKMKNIAGASGGGEDKRLKKNIEYILIYTKNYLEFNHFNKVNIKTEISDLLESYRKQNVSWKYTTVITNFGTKEYYSSTVDGDGNEIRIYKRINASFSSINKLMEVEKLSESEIYAKYYDRIFTTAMPQSSIRTRVLEAIEEPLDSDSVYSIEYVPKTGKNKGQQYEQFYRGEKLRLFAWFKDVAIKSDGKVYKLDTQGTFWDGINLNNLTKEGDISFENGKKPLDLLYKIITMMDDKSGIYLDFFSGSATTAHAVMKINVEDNGNRKFIMVQIPEKCNVSDGKKKYKSICEIGKERIRRAGYKIKEEWNTKHLTEGLFSQTELFNSDIGFKVFKLDSTNIKPWNNVEFLDSSTIFDYKDVFIDGRTKEDVLYEIMLKYGVFDMQTSEIEINGKTMYRVGKRHMIVCLEDNITLKDIEEIGELSPKKVIFKESGFSNDNDKINAVYNLKKAGVEDVKCI